MKICKLLLKAYTDNTFSSEKGEFTTTINPSNLKIYSSTNYSKISSIGNVNILNYKNVEPRIMSFSLLLDNTGVFFNSDNKVKSQLDTLQNLFSSYQKDILEPNYVRVIWGTIDFKGKLRKLYTNYTSFKEDGTPIRAEIDVEIIEQIENITQASNNTQKDEKDNKTYSTDSSDSQNNNSTDNQKNDTNNKILLLKKTGPVQITDPVVYKY